MKINKEQISKFDEAVEELIKSVGLEEEDKDLKKSEEEIDEKDELKKGKTKDEDFEEDEDDLDDEDLGDDEEDEDEDEDEGEDDCATEKDFGKKGKKLNKGVSLEDEEEYLEVSPFLKSLSTKLVKSIEAMGDKVEALTKSNEELKAFNKKLVKAISANGEIFKAVASEPMPQKSKTLVKSNGAEDKGANAQEMNNREICDRLMKGIESGKLNAVQAAGMIAQIESAGSVPQGALELAKSIQ